jgi:hypothetical protein
MQMMLEKILHRGEPCIAIKGKYNSHVYQIVNSFPGRVYSKTHGCFYCEYSIENLNRLKILLDPFCDVRTSGVGKFTNQEEKKTRVCIEVPDYLETLTRMRYSIATKANYIIQFKNFLSFIQSVR